MWNWLLWWFSYLIFQYKWRYCTILNLFFCYQALCLICQSKTKLQHDWIFVIYFFTNLCTSSFYFESFWISFPMIQKNVPILPLCVSLFDCLFINICNYLFRAKQSYCTPCSWIFWNIFLHGSFALFWFFRGSWVLEEEKLCG